MKRWRQRRIRSRPWPDVDCWALDLEMSGLDPGRDRIVAVGMVPVRERAVRVGARFASLVGGQGPLSGAGVTVHHLLPAQLVDAPPLGTVMAEVDRRLRDAVVVLHAGSVDLPFLRRAYRETGRPWPDPPVVDTLALLRRHERHRLVHEPAETAVPASLSAARARFGLPAHDSHDALSDAIATAELLLVLAQRLGARTVGDLV
ncbi:MAG: 3'-5' exonuclease [Actinomycetota bacterium]|nr:3'-5' exonuclease [Actinomycetota bacterium]